MNSLPLISFFVWLGIVFHMSHMSLYISQLQMSGHSFLHRAKEKKREKLGPQLQREKNIFDYSLFQSHYSNNLKSPIQREKYGHFYNSIHVIYDCSNQGVFPLGCQRIAWKETRVINEISVIKLFCDYDNRLQRATSSTIRRDVSHTQPRVLSHHSCQWQ